MDKQKVFHTLKQIIIESEKIVMPVFENNMVKYNIEFENWDEKNNYLLTISYTTKNNKTFVLEQCHLFQHPQGGLMFVCNDDIKNNNPVPDENYHRMHFMLRDYTAFRNISYDEKMVWRQIKNYEEGIQAAKDYFEFVKEILLTEEMQKFLFTDYWINVPINYAPYK